MAYAKQAFGPKKVRQISSEDIDRFNEILHRANLSPSTRAKHLRVLHACLRSAVNRGFAGRNPVKDLDEGERPQRATKEAAYFENDELPALFARLPVELAPGIPNAYRAVCLVALKTGMRQGELLALTWGDVNLQEATIHVRRALAEGKYIDTPKNRKRRNVDVAPEVVTELGEWWGACGRPEDSALVFPAVAGGYMNPQTLSRRQLYPAMKKAELERVGPTGEKRTFHSFRHTFAKRALENGRQVTWLSRHLGHSSLNVTTEVYGHWEEKERKREAALMEGVFGV